ncbi:T9SS type A sorting domain-containing protein [bacterium]|nr:T9SS type A sorting domain-containing protein [bacterium]
MAISNTEHLPASVASDAITKPASFSLSPNYPNPFNPETVIRFQLSQSSWAKLKIINTFGREMCTLTDSHYAAGHYSVRWDGCDSHRNAVSSGIYLYQLKVGRSIQVGKMNLLR